MYASFTFTLSSRATRICVSTSPDTTDHLTRGATGAEVEEEVAAGAEERDTEQGMETEPPSGAETGPGRRMFTRRCRASSAEEKRGVAEREEQKWLGKSADHYESWPGFKCTLKPVVYFASRGM